MRRSLRLLAWIYPLFTFGCIRNITPAPIRGTEPVSDPYAFLPVPEPSSCLMTNAVIKSSQSLNPGTYCGGLNVDSSAKLTSPVSGTYKNMQFMPDRDLSGSKFNAEWSQIFSGATLEYDGAMYLPEQNFWVSGTAHEAVIKAYSPAFALVADTVWIQGNARIEIRQEDRRDIGEVSGKTGFAYSAKLVK